MKKGKIAKKLLASIFAWTTACVLISPNAIVPVEAKGVSSENVGYGARADYDYWLTDENRTTNMGTAILHYHFGDESGETLYCVNPFRAANHTGEVYQNDGNFETWTGINYVTKGQGGPALTVTNDDKERIIKIAYFGYDYPGHQTNAYLAAAQAMIWETVADFPVTVFKTDNPKGCYNQGTDCGGAPVVALTAERNEIERLIKQYDSHISFEAKIQKSDYLATGTAVTSSTVLHTGDIVHVKAKDADLSVYRFQPGYNNGFEIFTTGMEIVDPNLYGDDAKMATLNNEFLLVVTGKNTSATLTVKSKEEAYSIGMAEPFIIKTGDKEDQELIMRGKLDHPDYKSITLKIGADEVPSFEFEKVDPSGKYIAGAEIGVYDGNTEIYKFTTTASKYTITNADKLKANKTYTVKELKVPAGYVKAKDGSFTIPATIPAGYTAKYKMTDGQVFASKVDQNGKALSGASMQVLEGTKVIDSWTTDGKAHAVKGLEEGKTYTLHEDKAPDGYLLAPDQTFTASSKMVNLTATDRQVTAQKKDANGGTVSGAKMQVLQGTKVIDEWTTDGKVHAIKGLEKGKEYILREVTAPKGYIKAKDVKFTVNDDLTEVSMTDGQVKAKKVDVTGKAISGAKLQVLLGATVIDSWTTDGSEHIINGLEEGKSYVLHEAEAPAGYAKAADITFTASTKVQTLTMTDSEVIVKKADSGNTALKGAVLQVLEGTKVIDEWTTDGTDHRVKGIEIGKSYTLHEKTAPKGYVLAKDVKFTVTAKSQTVTMHDGQVKAKKVDATGKAVSGIKLQVLQGTKVIDEWTTDGTDHVINGLAEGTSYKLHEAEAPAGYALAADITFTASTKVQTLTMTDVTVSVTKTDDLGNQLKGAVLQILEGTKVVTEWTTDGTVYKPKGLKAGVEYTLHEKSAPNGYEVAADQKFTLADKNITLKAIDKRMPIKVTAIKTDSYDKTVRLSGAEFTIYNKKDDSVAKLTNGKDAVVKTNDRGVAEFSLYYDPANYYLKETGAPAGYNIDEPDKKYDIISNGVFEFSFIVSDTSKAEINMIKVDAETGERTQGDAKFDGAEYEVTDTQLNKVVGTFTLGADGKSTAPIKGIALDGRTYVLKETKAPEGYQLSSEAVEFTPTQDEFVLTVTHKDSVKKNHIRVMKVYDNNIKGWNMYNDNFFLSIECTLTGTLF